MAYSLTSRRKVIWNQYSQSISNENYVPYDANRVSISIDNGVITQTWLSVGSYYSWSTTSRDMKQHYINNYYYLCCEYCADFAGYFGATVGGQTIYSASLSIPNVWTRYAILLKRKDGGDTINNMVYVNRFNGNTGISVGCTCKVRNIMTVDVTRMYGAGNEPDTVAKFEADCLENGIDLNTFHPYNSGTEIWWKVPGTDMLNIRRNIILNEPHLITPAPAVLQSFETNMVAPLKECKVSFSLVQEGSGDPSPDNIRPITGWTGIDVSTTAKNLLDPSEVDYDPNVMIFENGIFKNVNTDTRTRLDISVQLYDTNRRYIKNVISAFNISTGRFSATFENDEPNCKWVRFKHNGITADLYVYIPFAYGIGTYTISADIISNDPTTVDGFQFTNLQLEFGSSATPYEPYQGTTIPIDWSSSARTVYGGYVDLLNGVLVATHRAYTMDETSDIVVQDSGLYTMIYPPDMKSGTFYSDSKAICDKIKKVESRSSVSTTTLAVLFGKKSNRVYFYNFGKGLGLTTKASVQEWLKDNPITFTYPLDVEQEFQLDPVTIKTLKGQNNLWSNANGNVELKYWKH